MNVHPKADQDLIKFIYENARNIPPKFYDQLMEHARKTSHLVEILKSELKNSDRLYLRAKG